MDLQKHQGGSFIGHESASGAMTGWRTLMGIPNGRVFSPSAKGFFIEQCSWFPSEDFLCQGAKVCVYSAKVKFPNAFKMLKIRMHRSKEFNTRQIQKIKFHIYCRNSIIPSTN
jgi:hypothetical protein